MVDEDPIPSRAGNLVRLEQCLSSPFSGISNPASPHVQSLPHTAVLAQVLSALLNMQGSSGAGPTGRPHLHRPSTSSYEAQSPSRDAANVADAMLLSTTPVYVV